MTLTAVDRIQLLEEIDFSVELREHQWYSMQERLNNMKKVRVLLLSQLTRPNTDLRGWLILQQYQPASLEEGLPHGCESNASRLWKPLFLLCLEGFPRIWTIWKTGQSAQAHT
jgi:hypothetical protein